ncbi:MAG: SDR family NAD(P)-dependent oxidoreductase, partial [bacterium]
PPDMLDTDLDLEADLGIDTVKQAEMFAAVREEWDIPREDDLALRDFPTLQHVIGFVYDRRPELAGSGTSDSVTGDEEAAGIGETAPASPAGDGVEGSMGEAETLPRRVPVPRLRPALDLCRATGVALDEGSRIVVMGDSGGVGDALVGRLEDRGTEVLRLPEDPPLEDLTDRLELFKRAGPVHGVYWLPAMDVEDPVEEMDLEGWRRSLRARVKLLYHTMRNLYEQIDGPGTFLVSGTRLGGCHGYDEEGAAAPMGGGVSGFTKAYKREKPEALVKVVDFVPSRKTASLADRLIAETLSDPGVVEVGYSEDRRWTVGLEEQAVDDGRQGMVLDSESVFLVTGAAGSITSAITADLAAASGGIFHLLDLTPEPDPDDLDLRMFAEDREGLKRRIFERIREAEGRATPAMVEKELTGLERLRAALAAIRAVEEAGGTAYYYSVDLLDAGAMAGVMSRVAERSGRVDVLLHAAGVEISHVLPDKEPGEYDLVFDVKSDGWFNVMSNLGGMTLGAAVVFSSIAGRFGNMGQTDYSAANDLLCKSISSFRNRRPDTRGLAMDWTAWSGIGMATRGSIPTVMREAGIDMLPPEAGIPWIRRELTAGARRGEVVVADSLGVMLEESGPDGGLDVSPGGEVAGRVEDSGVMVQRAEGMFLHGGLTVEADLDPEEQPFLDDHRIDGTPVLPGVMGIEAMTEAACLLYPGMEVEAVEDVEFQAPFKFYRGEPRTVRVRVRFGADGERVIAHCVLEGSRTLHGREEPEVTTHFTSRVVLAPERPESGGYHDVPPEGEKTVGTKDIYRVYFHGPAYRVLADCWRQGDEIVGRFADGLGPSHRPEGEKTVAAPRLVELCFQTAGLGEMADEGRMGLPSRIDRLEFFGSVEEEGGEWTALVRAADPEGFGAEVIDGSGRVRLRLSGYRTAALPDTLPEELLAPLRYVVG